MAETNEYETQPPQPIIMAEYNEYETQPPHPIIMAEYNEYETQPPQPIIMAEYNEYETQPPQPIIMAETNEYETQPPHPIIMVDYNEYETQPTNMAENNQYETPLPFHQEMRARLLTPDSLAFGPGSISSDIISSRGGLPEHSLLLFKRNRAPRHYLGYVDAVSMSPVASLQNRGVKVFNAFVSTPVGTQASFLVGKMKEQLKHVSHAKHGPLAQQLLLTETLPQHEYELNVCNIADCLTADSAAVRRDAASRLERLILVTNHKYIKDYKTQLLAVARKTYVVIFDQTSESVMEDEEHLRACGHLHLVAVCALLYRTNSKPLWTELRPFMSLQKPDKNLTGYATKKEAFKIFRVFYEHLGRFLKESKSKTATSATSDLKKFIKVDFCDQMASLFLILKQIAEEGEWSDNTTKLLADLEDLCDVMARDGRRLKPEAKTGVEALLIRSLVILLNSTFAKAQQAVGEGTPRHQIKVAKLLSSMARTLQPPQVKNLMPLLSTVAFHESPEVCGIMTELLDQLQHPAVHTALDSLEASLGMADFHVDRPERSEEVCTWHSLKGRFGQQLVDCRVLVHAAKCKAKTSVSGKCVDQDGEETWREKRHVEVLAKLSSLSQGAGTLRGKEDVRKNLVQLLAFQNTPFFFYALESLQGQRLLEHLVNHRAAHRWLSSSVLSRVMYHVISGLKFLASQRLASREITTYYMLVGGRSRRGGVASEKMDVLTTDDFTVKLTHFGLSHQYQDEKGAARPVDSQGAIPILWTPPEALLRGEYCEASMVYSAGCVMYELWTHGCQPFATYQKSTADTVRMMLLKSDSTPLIRWPCIPEDVYSAMRECTATEPFSRPSLASLKNNFKNMHNRVSRLGPAEAFNEEWTEQDYPSFSDDQVRRKHVPELGIPPDIQQVIKDYRLTQQNEEKPTYRNMEQPRWDDYTDDLPEGTDQELNSPYWLQFAYLEDFTSVREKLPPSFAKKELLLLDKRSAEGQDHLRGVTDWLPDDQHQPTLEQESQDHVVHERLYKPAWTLLDSACRGLLTITPDGYICMQMDRVVHVLLSLARALQALHNANWLHRDIRASSILVDCQTGEVTLARLGRMCQMESPSHSVVGEPFEDSWRWLGPEVLSEGKYTRENDVFMFGTCIWETFWCREVTEKNPTATEMNCLPFADQPKDNILTLVRQKEALKKPQACPDWLYQLSINCRDPDPAMRPLISDIMLTLERELIQTPDLSERFLLHPKLLVAAHERCLSEGVADVPDLPARFQTKHATPFQGPGPLGRREDPTRTAGQLGTKSTVQEGGGACPTPYELVTGAAQCHEYLPLFSEEDSPMARKPPTCYVRESEVSSGSGRGANAGQSSSRVSLFTKIRHRISGRPLPPTPGEKAGEKDSGRPGGDRATAEWHVYEELD